MTRRIFGCGTYGLFIVARGLLSSYGVQVFLSLVEVHRTSSCGTRAGLVAPQHVGSWFPSEGSNLCPLHWKADSLPLDHQGSPDVTSYCIEKIEPIKRELLPHHPTYHPICICTLTICLLSSDHGGLLTLQPHHLNARSPPLPVSDIAPAVVHSPASLIFSLYGINCFIAIIFYLKTSSFDPCSFCFS